MEGGRGVPGRKGGEGEYTVGRSKGGRGWRVRGEGAGKEGEGRKGGSCRVTDGRKRIQCLNGCLTYSG